MIRHARDFLGVVLHGGLQGRIWGCNRRPFTGAHWKVRIRCIEIHVLAGHAR